MLVQYSYPKFLSVSLVVDDWSAEHINHSLLATNCNLFLLCYVLFVGVDSYIVCFGGKMHLQHYNLCFIFLLFASFFELLNGKPDVAHFESV